MNQFKKIVLSNPFVFVVFLLVGGLWCAYNQQEIWFDFFNYHYYNAWAFLNGKTFYNVMPAGFQSYFNPLLDLPMYAVVNAFNNHPAVVFFYQGLWAGALWFAIFKIILLFLPHGKVIEKWGVVAAFVFSCAGHGIVRQLGSSTNEIQISVFFLVAFYWFVKVAFVQRSFRPWVLWGIGLLLGMIVGLKPTVLPMCIGFGTAALLAYKKMQQPVKSYAIVVLGGMLGFLLTNGFWMYLLWIHFENPFFPFLNGVFESPYMVAVNWRDELYLPKTLLQWIFYPYYCLEHKALMTDMRAILVHFALTFTVVIALVCLRPWKKYSEVKRIDFVLTFWVISYLIWISLFAFLRYAIPLEAVSGILIVTLVGILVKKDQAKLIIYMALIGFSFLFPLKYNDWQSRYWPEKREIKQYYPVMPLKFSNDTVLVTPWAHFSYLLPGFDLKNPTVPLFQIVWHYQPEAYFKFDTVPVLKAPHRKFAFLINGRMDNKKKTIPCKLIDGHFFLTGLAICPAPDENGVVHGVEWGKANEFYIQKTKEVE